MPTKEEQIERMTKKTNKQGTIVTPVLGHCWEWIGLRKEGYGIYNRKTVHRLAYELLHGPIPVGMIVRHKCDTRNCWNPDHLELGTTQDNIQDKVLRGRAIGGPGKRGENCIHAKLTANDVEVIRAAPQTATHASLAQQFGVSFQQISKIRRGERWIILATAESEEDDFFRRAVRFKIQRKEGLSECWETQRERQVISFRNKKIVASRIAFTLSKGEIPDNMVVRHVCDNSKCINPEHLELGTHTDNMRDRDVRGRTCKGESHHASKLTADTARQVYELKGVRSCGDVANQFGISKNVVCRIWKKELWKHIH
jgi:hypothetical protein